MKASFKFALRESRAAFKNFKIFIASLFLGTVIVSGVGSVTANISDSIQQDGKVFLGGDVEVSQIQKTLTEEEKTYFLEWGNLSEVALLRTMAHSKEDSTLVDLKAVDKVYPLYGQLTLHDKTYSPDLLSEKGGSWGILLSNALAIRLNLVKGDNLSLGGNDYQVSGIIKKEPDANNQGFQLAPGAIVSMDSLKQGELIQKGSLVNYYNRIKLKQGVNLELLINNIKKDFPDQTWRVRSSNKGGAGLQNFVGNMGQFMTLVGLTALLVGGVGVSNAVRSYLEGKMNTIATYKILGGTGRIILQTYLGQVLLIASIAILMGLFIGASLPIVASELLKESLPISLNLTIFAKPLLLAAYYSLSIALIFTLWPLGKAVQTPATHLFRQTISKGRLVKQSLPYLLTIIGLIIFLVATIIYTSKLPRMTAGTLVAAAGAFFILWGTATVIKRIAKNFPRPKNPILSIALSNIHRPGNSTTSIIMSLGLGLILFTSVALIENNILREIDSRVNGDAPSFFFIDIQKDQHDKFNQYLKNRSGIEKFRIIPNLRGRVTHVKSIEASKLVVKQEGRWILRGDKGITFAPNLPANNVITAGEWWPADYDGPAQVSISKQMADSMALVIGDEISLNILGRDFTLSISSIREFSWGNLGINYVMMLDPNTLKSAPFTYVASAKSTSSSEPEIYKELYQKFPSLSIVRMKDVLDNALIILGKISSAIDVMAAITIISGILVLAGAIAAGHKARIYDAAVLKIVGATRFDILKAYVVEFILLGIMTGVIAIILGSLGAYMVATKMMEIPWELPLSVPLLTVSGSVAVTLLFGIISIWLAMSIRPAQILRNS